MSNSMSLVVGTGGSTKARYLSALVQQGSAVVAVDTPGSRPTDYPIGVDALAVDVIDEHHLRKCLERRGLRDTITHVCTILEPCVEAAGWCRDELKINGLGKEECLLFRDKLRMQSFFVQHGIPAPQALVVDPSLIGSGFRTPFDAVLKPAFGFGNLGVRRVKAGETVKPVLRDAERDLLSHPWSDIQFTSLGSKWLLSEFVSGREVEVDMIVSDGILVFCGVQEKTVIQCYGANMEENNAITPPLTLTAHETRDLQEVCANLASSAAESVFNKRSIRQFTLYVEFRIANDGTPYCLEMAYRIGGGLVPEALKRSTGVDLFQVAAACALGRPISPLNIMAGKAVYWQLLYSRSKGKLVGIEGLDGIDASNVMFAARPGHVIRTPQSDALACLMFEAETPREVADVAARHLSRLRIAVQDNGFITYHPVPLSSN